MFLDILMGIGEAIGEFFGDAVETVGEGIGDAVETAGEVIGDVAETAGDAAPDVLNSFARGAAMQGGRDFEIAARNALGFSNSKQVAKSSGAAALGDAKVAKALQSPEVQLARLLMREEAGLNAQLQRYAYEYEASLQRNQHEHERAILQIQNNFQAYLQENDIGFRKWVVERQSQDAFEMLKLEQKFARGQLILKFKADVALWQAQEKNLRVWPLNTPYNDSSLYPKETDRPPFRIYWTESSCDTIFNSAFNDALQRSVKNFLLRYINGGRAEFLAGDWKKDFNKPGHIATLHEILSGQPTLIVNPVQNGNRLSLEIIYWGLNEDSPCQTTTLFSFDVAKVAGKLVVEKTREYVRSGNYCETDEINDAVERLNKIGSDPKKLESAYRFFKINEETRNEVQDAFSEKVGKIIGVALAHTIDLHFLVEYGDAPLLPQILGQTSAKIVEDYQRVLAKLAKTDRFKERFFSVYFAVAKAIRANEEKAKEIVRVAVALWAYRKCVLAKGSTEGVEYVEPADFSGCVRMVGERLEQDDEITKVDERFISELAYVFAALGDDGSKTSLEGVRQKILKDRADAEAKRKAEAEAKCRADEEARRKAAEEAQKIKNPGANLALQVQIAGSSYIFRSVPKGTFLMGSPSYEADRDSDETQHEVTLTQEFWLLETPVTQELWESVTGSNPSYFKGATRPVETVSWQDCKDFIDQLNAQYAPKGLKFDFPTEAEWEYACRAGTTTPFNFGTTLNGDKANCDGNYPYGTTKGTYLQETTPVKKYGKNGWGLFDMHGNVREWCKDWYGSYPSGSVTDPQGSSSGSYRVLRGGSWYNYAEYCRSAYRNYNYPSGGNYVCGFRLALRSAE